MCHQQISHLQMGIHTILRINVLNSIFDYKQCICLTASGAPDDVSKKGS